MASSAPMKQEEEISRMSSKCSVICQRCCSCLIKKKKQHTGLTQVAPHEKQKAACFYEHECAAGRSGVRWNERVCVHRHFSQSIDGNQSNVD